MCYFLPEFSHGNVKQAFPAHHACSGAIVEHLHTVVASMYCIPVYIH